MRFSFKIKSLHGLAVASITSVVLVIVLVKAIEGKVGGSRYQSLPGTSKPVNSAVSNRHSSQTQAWDAQAAEIWRILNGSQNINEKEHQKLLERLAMLYAVNDPITGIDVLTKLPHDHASRGAVVVFARELASRDPNMFMSLLDLVRDPFFHQPFFQIGLSAICQRTPETALDLIGLERGKIKGNTEVNEFMGSSVATLSRHDPSLGWRILAEFDPGNSQPELIRKYFNSARFSNSNQLIDVVNSTDYNVDIANGIYEAVRRTSDDTSNGVMQQIESLRDGKYKDVVLLARFDGLCYDSPNAAIEVLNRIQDDDVWQSCFDKISRFSAARHPELADILAKVKNDR